MGGRYAYRGDSTNKVIARLSYWLDVRDILGEKFFNGRHLVLASREAGDVSVLLGLGVPLENIVAFEWDRAAAAEARLKFPGLSIQQRDVGSITDKDGSFASVFLDFCATANDEHVEKLGRVMWRMDRPSVFGCGFLIGREQGSMEKISKLKEKLSKSPDAVREAQVARAIYIDQAVEKCAKKCSATLGLPRCYFYQSRSEDSKGLPYCFYMAPVHAWPYDHTGAFYDVEFSDTDFRGLALDLNKGGKRADLLLNIPATTIAAWKAHATRGTYAT